MKHINIALFVPDEGCPHRCSFCNQKTISGKSSKLRPGEIDLAVDTALKSSESLKCAELAFFGGSFTGIEREYMISLLKAGKKHIDSGTVGGIRVSTRPDYINADVLEILAEYGVTSIELGCQSMNDGVLKLNDRGHSREDIIKAAKLIKSFGFSLGVQMMTGLLGDSNDTAVETAKSLIVLNPDTARIYPTIVLENTKLCELYRKGEYSPQSLDDAVRLCAELLELFNSADIPVIRLGLHSGGNVEEGFVAGPYHPAFREMCESEIYFKRVYEQIKEKNLPYGEIEITVGSKFVSMLIGQKKCNIYKLQSMGYKCKIVQDSSIEKYKVIVRG